MQKAKESLTPETKLPQLQWIASEDPELAVSNCALIIRMLGDTLMNKGRSGMEFTEDDGDAYFRLLYSVGDALDHVTATFDKGRGERS